MTPSTKRATVYFDAEIHRALRLKELAALPKTNQAAHRQADPGMGGRPAATRLRNAIR